MPSSTGLVELYLPSNATVDVIALHGLNGHPTMTWTNEKSKKLWLSDGEMLPVNCPTARVLSYGYNADVTSLLGSTSKERVLQIAHTLIAECVADRQIEDAEQRPIIWICHSLGGIVLKRALAYSYSRTGHQIAHLHSIYTSTYAILFLGTPHAGSSKASLGLAAQRLVNAVVPSRLMDTDNQLLKTLQEGSETLQNVTDMFAPLMKRWKIFFFWEGEKMSIGGHWTYVVEETSAAPIIDNTERAGLPYSHVDMCRFESRRAPGYKLVVSSLMRYMKEAPELVSSRWSEELDMLKAQWKSEAAELLR